MRNDAKNSLIELVKHKNNQIKEEAIACIKEFHVTQALPILKLVFWNSNVTVKMAILDAISYLGSPDDIEFLHLIEKKGSQLYRKKQGSWHYKFYCPGKYYAFTWHSRHLSIQGTGRYNPSGRDDAFRYASEIIRGRTGR